jgi:TRAP-type C4-dicarboxylate transport system permease large subunit
MDHDRDADPAACHGQLWRRPRSLRDHLLLNLGIGLCHPSVGAILFVGCAVGKVTIEEVMRKIWPLYGVMFLVLMYIPEISLWLPRHVLR